MSAADDVWVPREPNGEKNGGKTPAQKVRAVFPEARSYQWAGPTYCIYPGDYKIVRGKSKPWVLNNSIGIGGRTAREAWANAAKGLRRYPWGRQA